MKNLDKYFVCGFILAMLFSCIQAQAFEIVVKAGNQTHDDKQKDRAGFAAEAGGMNQVVILPPGNDRTETLPPELSTDPGLFPAISIDPNLSPVTNEPSPPKHCKPHRIFDLDWNPDGSLLAVSVGSGYPESDCPPSGAVQIFDMATGTPGLKYTLNNTQGWVGASTFNPEGSLLAVLGVDGSARIYDLANPTSPLFTLPDGASGNPQSLAFKPGDTLVAVVGKDRQVRIYNWADPDSPPATLPGMTDCQRVAFNRDGTLLATVETTTGGEQTLNIYDSVSQALLDSIQHADAVPDWAWNLVFNPTGSLTKATGFYHSTKPGSPWPHLVGHNLPVQNVYVHRDSGFLAVTQPDGGVVKVYRQTSMDWPFFRSTVGESGLLSAGFNPNGTLLAIGGNSGTLQILKLENLLALPKVLVTSKNPVERRNQQTFDFGPHSNLGPEAAITTLIGLSIIGYCFFCYIIPSVLETAN